MNSTYIMLKHKLCSLFIRTVGDTCFNKIDCFQSDVFALKSWWQHFNMYVLTQLYWKEKERCCLWNLSLVIAGSIGTLHLSSLSYLLCVGGTSILYLRISNGIYFRVIDWIEKIWSCYVVILWFYMYNTLAKHSWWITSSWSFLYRIHYIRNILWWLSVLMFLFI